MKQPLDQQKQQIHRNMRHFNVLQIFNELYNHIFAVLLFQEIINDVHFPTIFLYLETK